VLVTQNLLFKGTGSNSVGAARLSVARAQRQLAEQAGIYLNIRNFSVTTRIQTHPEQQTINN
jgi:hypothetical protein